SAALDVTLGGLQVRFLDEGLDPEDRRSVFAVDTRTGLDIAEGGGGIRWMQTDGDQGAFLLGPARFRLERFQVRLFVVPKVLIGVDGEHGRGRVARAHATRGQA